MLSPNFRDHSTIHAPLLPLFLCVSKVLVVKFFDASILLPAEVSFFVLLFVKGRLGRAGIYACGQDRIIIRLLAAEALTLGFRGSRRHALQMFALSASKELRKLKIKGVSKGDDQFQCRVDSAVFQLADPGTSVA